jgi:hypothetical protein
MERSGSMTRDPHEDCRFWHLTPYQCARHHGRLVRMYAKQTRRHADEATKSATEIITTYRRRLRMVLLLALFAFGLAIWDILT